MKTQQSGFTLIELIAVIVILTILAVSTLPKFVDLTSQAKQVAVDSVAGDLSSAMAINYAAALAQFSGVPGVAYNTVDNCNDGGSLLLNGLQAGYSIASNAAPTLGSLAGCTLTANGKSASFQAIGAP